MYSKLLNRTLDPQNEILVTVGAYEALYATLQGHTNPGDEWIIIEPFFDCYVPMVQTAGGVPRFIALKPVSFKWNLATFFCNIYVNISIFIFLRKAQMDLLVHQIGSLTNRSWRAFLMKKLKE